MKGEKKEELGGTLNKYANLTCQYGEFKVVWHIITRMSSQNFAQVPESYLQMTLKNPGKIPKGFSGMNPGQF